MKFAEIVVSHKKEDFGIPPFFLKFPDFMLHWYLLHHPFYIQEITLENATGYHVTVYQETENIEKL